MSKLIIFNADDLGMAPEVDRGILRSVQCGLVKEVSACVSMGLQADTVRAVTDAGAHVGLHLCLTEGQASFGPQPGLTDGQGRFLGLPRLLLAAARGRIDELAVERELTAQLDELAALGIQPSHINGHHHAHAFPIVRDVVLREAARRACPHVRVPLEPASLLAGGARGILLRHLGAKFADGARSHGLAVRPLVGLELTGDPDYLEKALALARELKQDVVEWLVHPREGDTQRSFATVGARHAGPAELEAMESPRLREAIEAQGYVPASYLDALRA